MAVGYQIVILIFLALQVAISLQRNTETEPRFLEPVRNVTAEVGEHAQLYCRVESLTENYSVSWIKWDKNELISHNKLLLTHDSRIFVDGSPGLFRLYFFDVQFSDEGFYTCQINTNPTKESVGYLQVVGPETRITKSFYGSSAVEGYEGTFTCVVESPRENYTISWKHFGQNGNIAIGDRLLTRDPRISVSVTDNRIFSIKIENLQLADSGRYMCQLNTEPVQKKVGLLQVVVEKFTTPDPLMEAAIGEDVTLRCDFVSNPKFGVNWERQTENGSEPIDSNTKYDSVVLDLGHKVQMMLTIKNVNPDDFGSYFCTSNDSWNRERANVTLIEKEPWFSEDVPDVTVVVGSDVTIPCVVESLREDIAVVWMHLDRHLFLTYNNIKITNDPRYSLTVSKSGVFSLRIRNVQVEDSGRLSCEINTDPKKTSVGYLQVVVPYEPNDATSNVDWTAEKNEPWFVNAVPNVTVVAGSDVTIPCVVESMGEKYSVGWMNLDKHRILTHKNGTIVRDPRLSATVENKHIFLLRIENVQVEDSGRIACQLNTEPMKINVGFLQVIESSEQSAEASEEDSAAEKSPRVRVPNCRMGAAIGEYVTLRCNVKSNPNSVTYWKLDGEGLMAYSNLKYTSKVIDMGINKVQMRLTIKNLSPDDFGTYSCVAKNYLGDDEGNIILNRISEPQSSTCPSTEGSKRSYAKSPPKIRIPVRTVGSIVLEDVTLVCNVKSNPEPTVSWIRGGIQITGSNHKYNTSLIDDGVNQVQMGLTIKNVHPDDYGFYKCIARNSLGKAEGKITLFEAFKDYFDYNSMDRLREMHS